MAQLAVAPPGEEYIVCWRLSRHKRRFGITEDLPSHVRRAVWQPPLRPFRAGRLDLFHGLDVRVPRWRKTPVVATICDVFSVVSDEFANPTFRKKKLAQYQRALERAAAIICISESTAADLRTHLDAPPEKLVVIYLGVADAYEPEAASEIDRVREWYPIPEHYVLFLGRMDRRKNVIRLVQAFERAAPDLDPDLHLVLVGHGGYGSEEAEAVVERSPLRERILRFPYLESGHLPALYAAASALAFPSLYEGFGLPILEAMASGCPVLAGNRSSSPEIGGEALLTVDPTDVDAIADGLRRLMTDEAWRVHAIQSGLERARDFTWQRTAIATRRLYHRIASGEPAVSAQASGAPR